MSSGSSDEAAGEVGLQGFVGESPGEGPHIMIRIRSAQPCLLSSLGLVSVFFE